MMKLSIIHHYLPFDSDFDESIEYFMNMSSINKNGNENMYSFFFKSQQLREKDIKMKEAFKNLAKRQKNIINKYFK